MRLHRNAKTTPRSRAELVDRVDLQGWTVARAAQCASVSERTAYKWLSRARREGATGLEDRRSTPRRLRRRLSQIFGVDALTAIAIVGREVPGVEFGTAIIPTDPRHPMALAVQAMTVQQAIEGRLVLGIARGGPGAARAEAERAGRPAPRVVVSLPVCVTDDVERVRRYAAEKLGRYGGLRSYRAMLDREGVKGPEDICLIGDEQRVRPGIAALDEAGATDLRATELEPSVEERKRTRALLKSLL